MKKWIIILSVILVVVIAVGYSLCKARGQGRDEKCRSYMNSLAAVFRMYAQSNSNQLPPNLDALYPSIISDQSIFMGCLYHEKNDGKAIEYLPGLSIDCLPDSMVMFCRSSHRGEGRNVLYWPPKYGKGHSKYAELVKGEGSKEEVNQMTQYQGLMSEERFQKELHRMLNTPEYREQYTEEAIKTMEKYLKREP